MKRMISLILAAVLCFGLLPAGVHGEVLPDYFTAERKISLSTLEMLSGKEDDELVAVNLWLRGPSVEELEAMTPMEKPDSSASSEEKNAYASAYAQTRATVYSGIVAAFARKYLDETEQVLQEDYDSAPGFGAYVRRGKIAALAALDEVIWINEFGQSVTVVEEPAPEDKIAEPLREYMDTHANDTVIPVRLWLRGWSYEEFNSIVDAAYPTLSSPPEVFREYARAREQAAYSLGDDVFMYRLFAENHQEDFSSILFQSQLDLPVLVVTVPALRILSLASLKMVSGIEPAFGYDEALPDPELPDDPEQLKKIDTILQEFMKVAAHDEMIPVSITLKEPAEVDVLAANDGDPDRAADNEALREVYSALTSGFVENNLEPTDEVIFRGRSSPFVRASVPKYKIAGLAALDDVTHISWALGYDDPVYHEDGKELVVVPAQRKPAVKEKLSADLIEYMEGKADDAMIPIAVHLVHPSPAEIEAMIPIPQPDVYSAVTMEEVNAYAAARRDVVWKVFSAITTAFVEEHLDENDTIRYRGKMSPVVNCNVPKSKVLMLAELEEVTQIGYFPSAPAYPMWIRDDSEAAKKLTEPLKAHIENLADDEPVIICVDLHMPSEEIMERIVSVPKPGEDASQKEIDAYYAAYQEKWREQVSLRTDAFVNHTLSGSEPVPVYYIGQDAATVICEVPVQRIRNLAFGQEITQIDLAGDSGETDRSALAEVLVAAQAVDLEQYTEETVAGLREQIEIAGFILAKLDATQEEIDWAAAVLAETIASLEPHIVKPPQFEDVLNPDAYYYDAVYWAYHAEPRITIGIDMDHFGPDESCTRGQVVTFLWRAAGSPEPKSAETSFKDLKKGAFYEKPVAWAVENHITSGTSKTTFSPDGKCTRGQIVTFLWRYMGEPAPKSAQTPFKDLKEGGFYLDAVAWAVENEVTNGLSSDKFGPDATCTRAQVVTFLYRAFEWYGKS